MSADRKATSRDFLQLWGENAPHNADELVAPSYTNHQMPDAAGGTSTLSLAQWKALVADFHRGFSDVKMEILLQVAEGDYVCTRWRMTGTHTGSFDDMAATGKASTWTGVGTDRYEGDRIAESWVDWDKFSFLDGLGLVG